MDISRRNGMEWIRTIPIRGMPKKYTVATVTMALRDLTAPCGCVSKARIPLTIQKRRKYAPTVVFVIRQLESASASEVGEAVTVLEISERLTTVAVVLPNLPPGGVCIKALGNPLHTGVYKCAETAVPAVMMSSIGVRIALAPTFGDTVDLM